MRNGLAKFKPSTFAVAVFSTLLAGCSVNLVKYESHDFPKSSPFFESFPLTYGDNTEALDSNLQNAYSAAVDSSFYSRKTCHGSGHITATVSPDRRPGEWGIGAAFIPFWPALPVSETWHYHMDVQIFCNGTLTFKAEFEESEHVEAFWYGKMRADLVNSASLEMHRKLIERLRFETMLQRSTDLNAARDF